MSMLEMLPCPNPSCRGTGDSLEIREDPRCTRKRCCWVACDWCGVAGPTAGPSDESAIAAWNALPRREPSMTRTVVTLTEADVRGSRVDWTRVIDCMIVRELQDAATAYREVERTQEAREDAIEREVAWAGCCARWGRKHAR